MPIESVRVEDGIYHNHWRAIISITDITEAVEYSRKLAEEHGDLKRIAILDLSECISLPFDLSTLLKLAKKDDYIIGYVIVQPSKMAKLVASVIGKLITTPFILVETPKEALAAAREVLKNPEKYAPQKE